MITVEQVTNLIKDNCEQLYVVMNEEFVDTFISYKDVLDRYKNLDVSSFEADYSRSKKQIVYYIYL